MHTVSRTIVCAHCGATIEARTETQRFCSRACASASTAKMRAAIANRMMPDGLPARAHTQRAILRLLSFSWQETGKVADKMGIHSKTAAIRLRSLQRAGLAESVSVPAYPRGSLKLWRRVVPSGRVCAHPGCETVLSRYNPFPWCALHTAAQMSHEEYREVAG